MSYNSEQPLVITCSVCQRPVDLWEWWDDRMSGDRHIVARCHGAREEMVLTQDDIWRMHRYNMVPTKGVAFITTMLMPSPSHAGSSTVAALPDSCAR